MPNAREYALHCFSRSLNEQSFLTIEADCPDSPFVHMLTTTAFRRLTDIRQILSHLLHKPLPAKHQKIYRLLCLGATELLFMNTADYACLNEWVSLAKKLGNSALGGLVNRPNFFRIPFYRFSSKTTHPRLLPPLLKPLFQSRLWL